MVLQLPLVCNPGYFSHDELEWWARASVAGWAQLPWVSWTAVADFQYRPLTFNLWLLLAHGFAAKPYLMHLIVVSLGCVNALLLGACIEAAGAPRRVASVAAVVFVMTPYAAYTHGWVGTLADVLTLMAALLSLRQLQLMTAQHDFFVLRTAAVVFLTGAALLCKEAAVVLPLVFVAALYRQPLRKRLLAVIVLSALLVVVYLALRLRVILETPRDASAYAWAAGNIPHRLLEYALYPFLPPLLEVGTTLAKSLPRLLAAGACLVALLTALGTVGWRWALAWVALVSGLLAPVLILGVSYDHYAYLANAAAVGVVALAWPKMRTISRGAVVVVAAVAAVHAGAIMFRMHDVGVIQRNFYADLVERLAETAAPIDLSVINESDRWMAQRFLSGVAVYQGVTIEGRVALVVGTAPLLMRRDGHLVTAGE